MPHPSPGRRGKSPASLTAVWPYRMLGEWVRVLAEPLLAFLGDKAPGNPSSQLPLITGGPPQ